MKKVSRFSKFEKNCDEVNLLDNCYSLSESTMEYIYVIMQPSTAQRRAAAVAASRYLCLRFMEETAGDQIFPRYNRYASEGNENYLLPYSSITYIESIDETLQVESKDARKKDAFKISACCMYLNDNTSERNILDYLDFIPELIFQE